MEKFSIPEQPAFYKQVFDPEEDWFVAIDWVKTPTYELFIEDHERYEYPYDGWNYKVTPPQAYLDWVERNKDPEEIEEE